MLKIVITGGAGFVGLHVVERRVKDEYNVVIIDNLDDCYSPGLKKDNMACVLKKRNATFIRGDIIDPDFLSTVIDKDVEYVFLDAAQTGVRVSVENPFKFYKVNVGAMNVFQASRNANVKRVIKAS